MRLLFIASDFDVGGITASLRNLTALLVGRGHDVSVLNLPKAESLPEGFDTRVRLVSLEGRARLWNLSAEDIKKASFFGKIKYAVLGVAKKLMNRSEAWQNFVFKKTRLEGYDAVIGFRQGPVPFYLASRKSCGAKKCGFWHGDVEYMGDISSWDYYLSELDALACVSNAVGDGMKKRYPDLSDRIYTVYNVFEIEDILAKAAQESVYSNGEFNLVTVSRVDFEFKQLQFIPEIAKRLKGLGKPFAWHIVGDGADREKLEQLIKACGVEDCVILHGSKANPFPYVRDADLFVLTSLSESYGMVVVESLICGTPVVAGYYPALPEVLDGDCGVIAENSTEGIYNAVKSVIEDTELYKKIREGARAYSYTPDVAYNQFLEMVK